MSKQRDTTPPPTGGPRPKARTNPLGGVGRKPSTYVGDLDSLLAEVGEGPGSEQKSAPEPSEGETGREAKVPMKRINLDVPVSLHQRFKGVTGMRGVTMTEVLQQLIAEYVQEASDMFR